MNEDRARLIGAIAGNVALDVTSALALRRRQGTVNTTVLVLQRLEAAERALASVSDVLGQLQALAEDVAELREAVIALRRSGE